jgi:AcrR family transcriptional regulator
MPTIADIPLRERKQAQTRLALLDAVVARLDGSHTFDEIGIRELCDAANISEATFFNYFPRKTDVLVYFVQIWSLDLAWRVRQSASTTSARASIETIFASTAREMRAHPGVMAEIIAHQARVSAPVAPTEVSLAERLAAFPDRPGIEEVPAVGLDGLIPPLLARAVALGELPRTLDQRAAFLGLAAIFFGVPLILRRFDPEGIESAYRQQLSIYWAGLQAGSSASRRTRKRKPR